MMEYPGVGVGIFVRKGGKTLWGKRRNEVEHEPGTWCIPGGKLSMKEDPVDCAIRETREETSIEITTPRFFTYTNDVFETGKHYVSLFFVADWKAGDAIVSEPDKFERWEWFDWNELPAPLFLTDSNFLKLNINPSDV